MNDNAPNQVLRDHVTGHAFAMTLSNAMIQMIDVVAHGCRDHRAIRNWIATGHSLQSRGLIDWRGKGQRPHAKAPPEGRGMPEPLHNRIRLTRAGLLVHDLLAEAGLVKRLDARSSVRKRIAA